MSATTGSPTEGPLPRRPLWWTLGFALAFGGYYALLLHSDLTRPEPTGFVFEIQDSRMILRELDPDSPAVRAGLEEGDRIVAANGRAIRNRLDWLAIEMNLEADRPLQLDVARGDVVQAVTLVLARASRGFWTTTAGATLVIVRGAQLITLLLAVVVAVKRPFDRAARVGAWVLATLAVYSIAMPYQIAATWRALPAPAGLVLWIPFASSLVVPGLMFTFFAIFPRSPFRSRWAWTALWAPMAYVLFLQLQFFARVVYRPDQVSGRADWTTLTVVVTAAYTIAAVATMVFGYRRLTDVTDRRRVRVLLVGLVIGLAGILPIVGRFYLGRSGASLGDSLFASPIVAVGAILGLALPIAFAYAILRHRLFDIEFIVRRGLQYGLARRVLISVVPATATVFLADLLINRQIPSAEIVRVRGWGYVGLAGLAVVARIRRDAWLDGLDRRFFRERHSAERLLRGISDEVRGARNLEAVAPRVLAQLERALHPEFAALFLRRPGEPVYCETASVPTSLGIDPLPSASKMVGLLALLQKPVQVPAAEQAGLLRQLPAHETDWLHRSRVDLLVPVRFGSDASEALFLLGRKKSEEPYSSEDEDLLMAIGDAVALLLSHEVPTPLAADAFKECPECGACYDIGQARCSRDDGVLATTPLPAVLGGRYRLERRVGQGGMGTVYAALDTALDRLVSVKVLREDLVEGRRAADRFRSEARLAAALVHPNVVTVHDIGVTPSGRAFFVMELLEGLTLREELRRVGRLDPLRTLNILRGVCAAVEAAHTRHMIHRDLKPENICLCEGDSLEIPKVFDFGLAKALEIGGAAGLTESGVVVGTPPYMAPERLRGGEPSPDWDLWALAVVAFEMITGELPSTGKPGMPLRDDNLPSAALGQVFLRALASDPLDRPTSATEFLDELAPLLVEASARWPGAERLLQK